MENVNDRLKAKLIEELAAPQEVETESGRVKRQSVSQMIKALDYLKKHGQDETEPDEPLLKKRAGLYRINNRD